MKIVEWRADDVLQVPLSAVFRNGPDWAVFVANEGLAELRNVTLGRRNGQMTEVRGGLTEGELVVTHPSDAISSGATLIQRSQL